MAKPRCSPALLGFIKLRAVNQQSKKLTIFFIASFFAGVNVRLDDRIRGFIGGLWLYAPTFDGGNLWMGWAASKKILFQNDGGGLKAAEHWLSVQLPV